MSLTSKNKLETNKYELIVSVDAETFEQAVEKAYRKNCKKINVPGFRKGKAPRKMIEKLYGEGVFYDDAVNDLYPDAAEAAVKEAELTLVDRPEVEVTKVGREDGVEYKITCVTKPEVELGEYKGIKATKTVKNVTEDDIKAELEKMQDRNSRVITVDDRAAENGDTAVIDFEGFIDGEAFDGGKGENFDLTLGSGQFIPGFEDQIIGHNSGDEFDVNVPFPDDYHVEDLKGKPALFKVKLKEIKSKELPEIDDEFAKDVSEFDTLEELKKDIKAKIAESNDKAAETELENTLMDKVVEGMKAEIPEVMFENRITESVREFEYRLQSQGLNLETYLQYAGTTMDKFREGFKEQAEKQVKLRLALEKIVEAENITASEDELNEEYGKMASAYGMEADKIKELVPAEDISMDICANKAIDFVKENAEVTKKTQRKSTKKTTASKKTAKSEAEEAKEDKAE